MKIIIVAGGLATRMKPVTEEIPKCLIDVNSKPLIQHQLEFLRRQGLTDIIFCVAHLADKVKGYFGDGSAFGVNIQYVQETGGLLGTAGSVKLAEQLIGSDEDFIVYYGDNLTSMDFEKLIRVHKTKDALATIVMRPLPDGYKSSSLAVLDKDHKVKVLMEKPSIEEIEKCRGEKRYINSGIYVFNKRIFEFMPENTAYDFTKQLFPKLMAEKLGIYGYPTSEFFREIGRVEKYETFLREFKGNKNILSVKAVFLDRDGVINEGAENLTNPKQFKLISGVAKAVKRLNDSGYLVVVVTNQPIIAKGFCTLDDVEKIHARMKELLAKDGAHIDGVYVCPHHPEKGHKGEVKGLKIDCECRKPKPGLILQAIEELNIDVKSSWMIGDSHTDVAAGKQASLKTILIAGKGSGSAQEEEYMQITPDKMEKDLSSSVDYILDKSSSI